jgi:hypothetical protein
MREIGGRRTAPRIGALKDFAILFPTSHRNGGVADETSTLQFNILDIAPRV